MIRKVKNIDGVVKTFNTDEEFLTYVKAIYSENEDGQPYPSEIHWMPENIQQATEYIVEYCSDLELIEEPESTTLPTTVRELPEKLEVKNGYRNEPKIHGGRKYLSSYEVVGKINNVHIYAEIPADGAIEKHFADELVRRYNAFPGMLEALKEVTEQLNTFSDMPVTNQRTVNEAIQKAKLAITSATK